MQWRSTIGITFVCAAVVGCDKIPFIGGSSDVATDTTSAPTDTTAVPPQDTGQAAGTQAVTPSQAAAPTQTPAQATPPAAMPVRADDPDETPWSPTMSGTIDPGMSSAQVISTWGDPAVRMTDGNWTFFYYRNGCERRCGTFDVVFFEGDQVVDAIVRAPEHVYSGISSSPPNRAASFTPPTTMGADTLGING